MIDTGHTNIRRIERLCYDLYNYRSGFFATA